jgi:hypothetical protein
MHLEKAVPSLVFALYATQYVAAPAIETALA